ncbi:hypothetical protein ACKC9G_18540 [Pokkaliibacter sp. CJK22405]|uniref:hypothetical protein n=1 Tax=Pokkaliibacter sp. CJK22405 TaxID=3384615 RepID=UPI0039855D3A
MEYKLKITEVEKSLDSEGKPALKVKLDTDFQHLNNNKIVVCAEVYFNNDRDYHIEQYSDVDGPFDYSDVDAYLYADVWRCCEAALSNFHGHINTARSVELSGRFQYREREESDIRAAKAALGEKYEEIIKFLNSAV